MVYFWAAPWWSGLASLACTCVPAGKRGSEMSFDAFLLELYVWARFLPGKAVCCISGPSVYGLGWRPVPDLFEARLIIAMPPVEGVGATIFSLT